MRERERERMRERERVNHRGAGRLRGMLAGARLLALAVLVVGCVQPATRVAEGEAVPSYEAQDLAGRTVDLRSLRGEVVLLNVWATWCFPCRREMPAFEQLHRELGGRGLRIVAVSIDAVNADRDIREFVDEYDLTFDILHDPGQQVTRDFNTIGVPETFLIGADGRLRRHWMGRIDPHAENIRAPIREAMREAAAVGIATPR
jgi:cytochrome c biogenesis protein CcmG, thiol:disulfide interchange protein DsbE